MGLFNLYDVIVRNIIMGFNLYDVIIRIIIMGLYLSKKKTKNSMCFLSEKKDKYLYRKKMNE